MNYHCYILVGAAQSSLFILQKSTQACGWWIISHHTTPFPTDKKIASLSLFYHYFHQKYSDKLHSSVLPVQAFTANTRHAMGTMAKHPNSLGKQEVPFGPLLAKNCHSVEVTPERMLFSVHLHSVTLYFE